MTTLRSIVNLLTTCFLLHGFNQTSFSQPAPAKPQSAWTFAGTKTLDTQKFAVTWGQPTDDNYFSASIVAQPTLTGHYNKGNLIVRINTKAEDVQQRGPCTNCMHLGFRLFTQTWGSYVSQTVRQVRAIFDTGPVVINDGNLQVPHDATMFKALEVDFEGEGSKRNLRWQVGIRLPKIRSINTSAIDPDLPRTEIVPGQLFRVLATTDTAIGKPFTANLQGSLKNTRTGQTVNLILEERAPNSSMFVSNAVLAVSEADTATWSHLGALLLKANPGDHLTIDVADKTTKLRIIDTGGAPPKVNTSSYRLEIIGTPTISVDPDNGKSEELRVRLTDETGQPVVGENIIWVLNEVESHPVTTTDESGIAKLGFAVASGARFLPVIDQLPVGLFMRQGTYTAIAIPEDENTRDQLTSLPAEMSVSLKSPTAIEWLDENHALVSADHAPKRVSLQVYLGEQRLNSMESATELTANLRCGSGRTSTVSLTRVARSAVFQSQLLTPSITDGDYSICTASFANTQTELKYYKTATIQNETMTGEWFQAMYRLNVELRRAANLTEEVRRELVIKGKLLANAIRWLQEARGSHETGELPAQFRMTIAAAYMELLTEQTLFEYGEVIDRAPPQNLLPNALKNTKVRYACSAEEKAINEAIKSGLRNSWRAVGDAYMVIPMEIGMMLASPHAGAYTAITGRNLDGTIADRSERFAGGASALVGLATLALPIAKYGRAAVAFERAAVHDLRLLERSASQAFQRGPLVTIPKIESASLVSALTNRISKSKSMQDFAKKIHSAEVEGKRLIKRQQLVNEASQKLANLKTELDALKANRAEQQAARRGTAETSRKIRQKENAIAKAEKGVANKEKELAVTKGKLQKLGDELTALHLERELQKLELAELKRLNKLPNFNDKVGGVQVTTLYESHVQTHLTRIAGQKWSAQRTIALPAPYKPTVWGKNFKVEPGKPQYVGRPDHVHLNPTTKEILDSKWFNEWSGGPLSSEATSRLRQVVDSVEKYRLIQFNEARAARLKAGQSASYHEVWKEVLELEMGIVTPVPTPAWFQAMVRANVRGAGKSLTFKHLPVDLAVWIAAMR